MRTRSATSDGPEAQPSPLRRRLRPAEPTSVSRVDVGQLLIDVADRRPPTDAATVHDYSDTNRLPGKTIFVPPQ